MRICAAQFQPIAGDIAKNIERHHSLIELAESQRADLIFFPELSLTGGVAQVAGTSGYLSASAQESTVGQSNLPPTPQ